MINKYCYKCGTSMYGNKPCRQCGAVAIEMPRSKFELQTEERIKLVQADHKPKKGSGCIVMLVVALVMFGVPGLFMWLGPGTISFGGVSIVLGLVNYKVYVYRKNMSFEKKSKYFNLTKKTKKEVERGEILCSKCRQLLNEGMEFCPRCSAPAGEDIPIDLGLKSKKIVTKAKVEPIKSEVIKPEPILNEIIENEIQKNIISSKICTNCGLDVVGKKFCSGCGRKVEVHIKGVCTKCGSNIKDKKFCTVCGTKVEVR